MKDDDGEILPLMTRRGIGGHISIVREQNSVWLGLVNVYVRDIM